MLTCIGDLVEDIVVRPGGAVRDGTDRPARIDRRRGGSAANVAMAARAIGAKARFIGNVGADPTGDRLVTELRSAGVDLAVTRRGRTGTVVVMIGADGERSFLTDRGSALDLTTFAPEWLADSSVAHVPAYSLFDDPLRTTTIDILTEARNRRIPISIDASSVGTIEDNGVAEFRVLISEIKPSVFFCNRAEADLLAAAESPRLAPTIIIKQGPRETLVLTTDGATGYPVPPVETVVDTTGAGDAFAAGYLASRFMQGRGEAEAVHAAHELAARTLAVAGATPKEAS